MPRPAGWADLQAVYELAATVETRLFGAPQLELVHLRGAWERPSFEVGRDHWIATDGARVVGYADVDGDDQVFLLLDGADGSALLRLVETRATERGSRALQAVVSGSDGAACRTFEAGGYEAAREVWRMTIELDQEPGPPHLPDGVSVRAYDPESDAPAVHRLLEEAFAESQETIPAFEDWRAWMTGDPSFEPAVWFLAEANGRLAGVALCWREGFVKDLAVHPSWRRRGLGRALLLHVLREFRSRGVRAVALKVDSDNPTGAIRLYERAGMTSDRRYRIYERRLS
jgi:mycothiol synthase